MQPHERGSDLSGHRLELPLRFDDLPLDVGRIAELERTTDHDVIAFVSQVAERVGAEGRWLHYGLTSSDVVDTSLALQCRDASDLLLAAMDASIASLVARAREQAGTLQMGRTHSVHAEPTTFGLKLAGWAFELDRGRQRLASAVDAIATGKISGPVGTYSHLAPDIEAEVLASLGLHADPVSTQIVQRDRHAALLAAIAILGGSLERFATEIRNLQHTGHIPVHRMCVSCVHFRPHAHAGVLPHHCAFVDAPMADRHLRVHCPEHEEASAERRAETWARLTEPR